MATDNYPSGLRWEVVESTSDKHYRLFGVRINKSKSPRDGRIHEFQVIDSPDWVAVIAVTRDNRLVMVKQYRHGSGDLSLEPPGGLVKQGSTPEQSAREELQEETGYTAEKFELLGCLDPMPALFTNKFHVFFAKDAELKGNVNFDETEDIETVLISPDEVRQMIRSGDIACGIMIAPIYLYLELKGL